MGALSDKFQPKVRDQRHSKTGKFYQTLYVRSAKNVKLYIRARSAATFCNIVQQWFIPEMRYKFTRFL